MSGETAAGPSNGDVLRVRSDDADYQAQAAAEADFWSKPQPLSFEATDAVLDDGPMARYSNRRLTGDARTPWQDTIARYGTFRRGLFLGTSVIGIEARILDMNPTLHATFVDISDGALQRRIDVLVPRFPGRIETATVDLNFAQFDNGAYDLIVSSSTLHHITNLEHLAQQINLALTDDGYFFFQDFAGESRFQFSGEKKKLFETLYNRHIAKQPWRTPGVVWLDESDLSPFCGVRSADILPVFASHLQEERVRSAGALTTLMLRSRPTDWPLTHRPLRKRVMASLRRSMHRVRGLPPPQLTVDVDLVRDLAFMGDLASDAGVIAPGNAFGIYRKRK